MKILHLFIVLLLIAGCSGTKQVVKNETTKPEEKIVAAKDSVMEIKEAIIEIVDTVKVVETKTLQTQEVLVNEEIKELNQTTKKDLVINHQLWDELLNTHVSNKGNVNYKGLKANRKKLLNYIHVLDLAKSDASFETLPTADILAFWINAYNAMTVDLILRHYPIESIKDIKDPWDQRYWKLDGKWYNLNEIEHDILRKMDEPRIHFGIVCASYSCPKLLNEAFTASNLETQLTEVTKGFLADTERNIISENDIEISKIFQWFAKDFKQSGSLIDFLNLYSTTQISAKAKKSFKDYNWDLNE